MKYLSDYVLKALNLAAEAHAGQKDKSGRDYIFHPITVALTLAGNGCSEMSIAAGLLHDVVEDSDYTFDDIASMGFPKEVVDALRLLTHDNPTDYFDYVAEVKTNPIARQVKNADLLHNLDRSRLANPSERDLERWKKYEKALKLIEDEH